MNAVAQMPCGPTTPDRSRPPPARWSRRWRRGNRCSRRARHATPGRRAHTRAGRSRRRPGRSRPTARGRRRQLIDVDLARHPPPAPADRSEPNSGARTSVGPHHNRCPAQQGPVESAAADVQAQGAGCRRRGDRVDEHRGHRADLGDELLRERAKQSDVPPAVLPPQVPGRSPTSAGPTRRRLRTGTRRRSRRPSPGCRRRTARRC